MHTHAHTHTCGTPWLAMVALKNMFGVFSINDILSKNIDKTANTSSSKPKPPTKSCLKQIWCKTKHTAHLNINLQPNNTTVRQYATYVTVVLNDMQCNAPWCYVKLYDVCIAINQSINQSISLSVNQYTNLKVNQSINQSMNQWMNESTNQPIKSINQPINHSINQSIKSMSQSINQWVSQSTHLFVFLSIIYESIPMTKISIYQSINLLIYQPINLPICQSIYLPVNFAILPTTFRLYKYN